jgi:pterin-4a-carbinolamine dehydratase
VSLTTNDYKGVTEKDFELALKMEEVFSNSSDS